MENVTIKDVILAIVTIKKHTARRRICSIFLWEVKLRQQMYLFKPCSGRLCNSLDNGVYFIVSIDIGEGGFGRKLFIIVMGAHSSVMCASIHWVVAFDLKPSAASS